MLMQKAAYHEHHIKDYTVDQWRIVIQASQDITSKKGSHRARPTASGATVSRDFVKDARVSEPENVYPRYIVKQHCCNTDAQCH